LANSSSRPHLEKKPLQKRAGVVAHDVGPELKPQHHKKKRKKKLISVCLITKIYNL
jgi:hypothetical protein